MIKGILADKAFWLISKKVDMFKEGKKLDKKMDSQWGKKHSEKIQRGTVTSMLTLFLKGLWVENPESFAAYLEGEAQAIRKGLK